MPGIFLIQNNDTLVEMNESAYKSEDLLQELIAKYPSLLAGDQMESENPRRWLLIRREMPVPGEQDGSGRWSLDHLFLDQDAIPTLIEVKRSTDTRIRREVVGQMLDYAANAVVYWPVEEFRAHFERECEATGSDPEEKLRSFLGEEANSEEFWQRTKTNLQAGRIRMVFVADVIPNELRRIVEFLNQQMDPAEVLAVEIKQYVGEGLKTLVPRVIGQTAEAQGKKGTPKEARKWDEKSFFEEMNEKHPTEVVAVARRLYDHFLPKATRMFWGIGKILGNFAPLFDDARGKQYVFNCCTFGGLSLEFTSMKTMPFSDLSKRRELIMRLNKIPGISIPDDRMDNRKNISFKQLVEPEVLNKFIEVMDWAVNEIVRTRTSGDST